MRKFVPPRTIRTVITVISSLAFAACGSHTDGLTPSQPSSSGMGGSTPAPAQVIGQAVGALDSQGIEGVKVAASGLTAATSDSNGFFTLQAGASGTYRSTLSNAGFLDRQTTIGVPGPTAQLSLIPRSFDLTAFDQMVRQSSARLQRWTRTPALVIMAAELTFSSLTASTVAATGTRVQDGDVNTLRTDLVWGLPQMTGGAFSNFAASTVEVPTPGSTVSIQRDGTIVVARYQGLTAATGYAGFGRWSTAADGIVTAGAIFFDADVDRTAASSVRRALHVHEMGHALGYSHVTTRESVMNPSPSVGPNDFDRDATRIAFERVPGNTSPDSDPATFVVNASTSQPLLVPPAGASAASTWGPPLP